MSTHKDLLDRLADARPRRLDPDHPGPGPAGFMTHIPAGRPPGRTVRRRLLVGLVPATAVVAAGAVALSLGGTPRKTGPAARPPSGTSAAPAPANARDLFLVAAGQTEKAPPQTGRYRVQDVEFGDAVDVGPAARPYRIMRKTEVRQWLPVRSGGAMVLYDRSLGAAPISAADVAAWKADGSPSRWTQPGPEGMPDTVIEAAAEDKPLGPRRGPSGASFTFAGGQVTMADLDALPTDPAALRRWVVARRPAGSGEKFDDYTLFILGEQLVTDLPVSARVRAAAYRMMADLRGTQSLGAVTDQRGRAGIAVGYTRKGDGGHRVQSRLVIDPRTGEALAEESWWFGSGKTAGKAGTLSTYTLVISTRYTDGAPPTTS